MSSRYQSPVLPSLFIVGRGASEKIQAMNIFLINLGRKVEDYSLNTNW